MIIACTSEQYHMEKSLSFLPDTWLCSLSQTNNLVEVVECYAYSRESMMLLESITNANHDISKCIFDSFCSSNTAATCFCQHLFLGRYVSCYLIYLSTMLLPNKLSRTSLTSLSPISYVPCVIWCIAGISCSIDACACARICCMCLTSLRGINLTCSVLVCATSICCLSEK